MDGHEISKLGIIEPPRARTPMLGSMHNRRQSMQTKYAIAVCTMGLAMWGWATSASAHHAFAAEFDANKPVNFKGKISKMEWINPHTWLHVDVKNPDGSMTNWAIEAGTPNVLFRRGFTKQSLLPGTDIAIDGDQRSKNSVSCGFLLLAG